MPNTKETEKKEPVKETTEKKETPKVEETKKETTTSAKHPLALDMNHWSLSKVAFLVIIALAVLHLLSSLFAIFGIPTKIISSIQAIASGIATAIVAIVSWNYAKQRNKEWKIIYFVCLAVVILCIIVPLVF